MPSIAWIDDFLGAWVAFAKDPMGLSEYGWPEFSFDGTSFLSCFSFFLQS
jgi:hypothetical protein